MAGGVLPYIGQCMPHSTSHTHTHSVQAMPPAGSLVCLGTSTCVLLHCFVTQYIHMCIVHPDMYLYCVDNLAAQAMQTVRIHLYLAGPSMYTLWRLHCTFMVYQTFHELVKDPILTL